MPGAGRQMAGAAGAHLRALVAVADDPRLGGEIGDGRAHPGPQQAPQQGGDRDGRHAADDDGREEQAVEVRQPVPGLRPARAQLPQELLVRPAHLLERRATGGLALRVDRTGGPDLGDRGDGVGVVPAAGQFLDRPDPRGGPGVDLQHLLDPVRRPGLEGGGRPYERPQLLLLAHL